MDFYRSDEWLLKCGALDINELCILIQWAGEISQKLGEIEITSHAHQVIDIVVCLPVWQLNCEMGFPLRVNVFSRLCEM